MRRHYQNIERIMTVARRLEDLLQNVCIYEMSIGSLNFTNWPKRQYFY